jgi:hypothetical protein
MHIPVRCHTKKRLPKIMDNYSEEQVLLGMVLVLIVGLYPAMKRHYDDTHKR